MNKSKNKIITQHDSEIMTSALLLLEKIINVMPMSGFKSHLSKEEQKMFEQVDRAVKRKKIM